MGRSRLPCLLLLSQVVLAAALSAQASATAVRLAERPAAATQSTITPESIEAHIAAVQGSRSGVGDEMNGSRLNEVAAYVHDTLAGYGLAVTEDPVTYSGQTFPNIVGTMQGTTCPEKTFIVSAHYDGVSGSPAADDDASGVAAVLEIARALSAQPLQASVDFVAFSFEEQGMIGSGQMATAARSSSRQLVGMINFDMIAYTCGVPGCQQYPEGIPPPQPAGDFIAAIANTASRSLLESFAAASASAAPELIVLPLEVAGNGETVPDVRRADHAPFWDHGYQALFVTDTANLRNPYYHQTGDTLETLNLGFAADVASASAATVVTVLTADGNGDGRADVCGPAPVGGSPVSQQPETPSQSVRHDSSRPSALMIVGLSVVAIAVIALASGWRVTRRRSRR
jgi:hypothetical protein